MPVQRCGGSGAGDDGRVGAGLAVPGGRAGVPRQAEVPGAASQPGLVKVSPSCAIRGEKAGFAPVTPGLRTALPLFSFVWSRGK